MFKNIKSTFYKLKVIVFGSLVFFTIQLALATDEVVSVPKEKALLNVVDETHKVLSNSILMVTNRIDRFFGSKRADDESNGSTIRVSWDHKKQESLDYDSGVNLRMNFRFPELQKKLRFQLDNKNFQEDGSNLVKNEQEILKQNHQGESEEAKEVEKITQFTKKWSFRLEAALNVSLPIDPFLNFRVWKSYAGKNWELNPTHEVYISLENGFGTRHSYNIDFKLNPSAIIRLENSLNFTDKSDEITSSHGPSLFVTLSSRRAFSISARASGRSRYTYHISNYSAYSSYRQLVHRKWLFFEISPSINFSKENNFDRVASLFIKLEAVFGSI